jgi:hypothetical protein
MMMKKKTGNSKKVQKMNKNQEENSNKTLRVRDKKEREKKMMNILMKKLC